MALRRALSKRLFNQYTNSSPAVPVEHSPIPSPIFQKTLNAAKTNFHREFLTSPDSADSGFFWRFLHRREINNSARMQEFLYVPARNELKEKIRSMNVTDDRLRLDGLSPPLPQPHAVTDSAGCGITVSDAKKIMRSAQLEKVRSALRRIPANSIPYSEYVRICVDECSNPEQGTEFAKRLDESGNVIVLGNVVFLWPEQVAKSVEKVISNSIAIPDDPRRKELEHMEIQKAAIDQKAQQLVQAELYCGLGFLVLQTLGLARLSFGEPGWGVMEPICFFATLLYPALAYLFFLRTSKEPTFEGYSQRRFKVKQKKLMEVHNFDVEKYNELCRAFYPNYEGFPASDPAGGAVFGAVYR